MGRPLSGGALEQLELGFSEVGADVIAEQEALEYGFYFGRVVWFDPYPFNDELVLDWSAAKVLQPAPAPPPRSRPGRPVGTLVPLVVVHAPSDSLAPSPSPTDALSSLRGPSSGSSASPALPPLPTTPPGARAKNSALPSLPPSVASTRASSVDGFDATALPPRPRRLWRRRISWSIGRMRRDSWLYLQNHHFVLSVAMAHPLNPIGKGLRLLLLLSSVGVALCVQLLLDADLRTTVEEVLAELVYVPSASTSAAAPNATSASAGPSRAGGLSVEEYPELPTVLVTSALTLAITVGAFAVTCWEVAAKTFALPPCARHAEALQGRLYARGKGSKRAEGGERDDGQGLKGERTASGIAAGGQEAGAPRRLPLGSEEAGRSADAQQSDGCCGWLRASLTWLWSHYVAAVCICLGLLGLGAGSAALLLSERPVRIALNAGASLVQAALLSSPLADLAAFALLRHQQLRRFGQVDAVRASLYPHGLGRPSEATLLASMRSYKPLPDGPVEQRRRALTARVKAAARRKEKRDEAERAAAQADLRAKAAESYQRDRLMMKNKGVQPLV